MEDHYKLFKLVDSKSFTFPLSQKVIATSSLIIRPDGSARIDCGGSCCLNRDQLQELYNSLKIYYEEPSND